MIAVFVFIKRVSNNVLSSSFGLLGVIWLVSYVFDDSRIWFLDARLLKSNITFERGIKPNK